VRLARPGSASRFASFLNGGITLHTRSRSLWIAILFFMAIVHCRIALAESAKKLYKAGEAAETRDDLETAFQDYLAALGKAPADIRYKVALERVRAIVAVRHVHRGEAMEKTNRTKEALVEFFQVLNIDPGNALAEQDIEKIKAEMDKKDKPGSEEDPPNAYDLDRPAPPVHLDSLSKEPITLHMTEQSSTLYETIGRAAGINVLIDPDYVSKRVTVDLKMVTLSEALRILGDLSNSFWKASTHDTIYVATDNRAKRTQLQQMAVETFYLSNVSQQSDLNDIQTTLRNVLPNAKMFAVPSQSAIVIRGTPDEIVLAKSLITSLDVSKPEVLVDIYVMEVSRDKLRNIGISPPTSLAVTVSSSATLNQIGRSSSYSYSLGQAAVDLLLTDSDTRIIQNPSLRAVDGQKATLKIGERIPVATGSYTTATSSTSSAVQTQFQYIDVGVNVDMTPTIHENRDVTMKLSVEVSSETGTDTIDGVAEPVISQEKSDQVIRLKDGEVSILAGLVKRSITKSVSGTPGLGETPGLKYLFSTQQNEVLNDELVFMIIPHVVRAMNVNAGAGREIDIGTGESVRIRPLPDPTANSTTSAKPQ
jgi:general secretion pathway protein D